ncbi:chemotaxis protein MotA [Rhodothalassium salexigens DSM 2132]|uniref:Chemotaxis protein MotA n=1 Tax=Rhodothalassium salexigens DSM 2132 TaxID=1188247 RepID=A0A4R2PGF4_RHOSA|nr:MotA/TolQ/ExbB proton channel family protein [Rhodothalassium salexigens]MBB4211629.1 chemotaxis protein MotA [Rhodothalassium salexigens DSM 2132]MBK1639093.1 hypothetical protein [Rhodothalassium salexigens DSM 2132]TCP34439.1 chemotaxis protein MotA [Rhodothalassium salexigens DSM 2132]
MSTLVSLILALALLVAALVMSGQPLAYLNAVGLVVVVAGSAAVTAVSFRPAELAALPGALARLAFGHAPDAGHAGVQALELAEESRRDGILALERSLPLVDERSLLGTGLALLIDGATPEDVDAHMAREAATWNAKDLFAVDVLRRLGEVAPAMGLIGTLIGLVNMLTSLNDPSTIGPAMAIALLTTFYGIVLAHMVMIPLATKVQRAADETAQVNEVYRLAMSSIGRQENPRRLEMAINAILPPARRIAYFD